MVKAKPIKTLDEFRAVHLDAEEKLENYSSSSRSDYAKFEPWVKRDMNRQLARFCNATNLHSRIRLADLLLKNLSDEPAIETGPLYFVTIVSREYVVRLEDAVAMPPGELHDLVYRLQQPRGGAMVLLTDASDLVQELSTATWHEK